MALTKKQRQAVEDVLRNSLRNKFQNYVPESSVMPFHTRLLGKDRMALFSFMQSLNTTFGTSIFEPAAVTLASRHFASADAHISAGENISEAALSVIQGVMDNLTTGAQVPCKYKEISAIREVCRKGTLRKVKLTKVDISLRSKSKELYFIDLKTVKPNIGEFKGYKRTLLEWVAAVLASDPEAKINTLIAIPYNPYEPEPYNRWTMRGMLDLDYELKVAGEFWDFVGGEGAYEDLLDCFERVGIELRSEIDEYFSKFNS